MMTVKLLNLGFHPVYRVIDVGHMCEGGPVKAVQFFSAIIRVTVPVIVICIRNGFYPTGSTDNKVSQFKYWPHHLPVWKVGNVNFKQRLLSLIKRLTIENLHVVSQRSRGALEYVIPRFLDQVHRVCGDGRRRFHAQKSFFQLLPARAGQLILVLLPWHINRNANCENCSDGLNSAAVADDPFPHDAHPKLPVIHAGNSSRLTTVAKPCLKMTTQKRMEERT